MRMKKGVTIRRPYHMRVINNTFGKWESSARFGIFIPAGFF